MAALPDPLSSMYTLHLAEIAFSKGVPLPDIQKAATQEELIRLIHASDSLPAPRDESESQQEEPEVLCRWSRGTQGDHEKFRDSCRAQIECAKAAQDERNLRAEAMAIAVAVEDRQGLAKLRKPYSAQSREHGATQQPRVGGCAEDGVGRNGNVAPSLLRWASEHSSGREAQ